MQLHVYNKSTSTGSYTRSKAHEHNMDANLPKPLMT